MQTTISAFHFIKKIEIFTSSKPYDEEQRIFNDVEGLEAHKRIWALTQEFFESNFGLFYWQSWEVGGQLPYWTE